MKKRKFEKNLLIMNELLAFCLSLGGTDFHADLERGEGSTFFTVRSPVRDIPAGVLEEFVRVLNIKRLREVEQDCWELMGESDWFDEPELVGMMLDSATAVYENGEIIIHAERKD